VGAASHRLPYCINEGEMLPLKPHTMPMKADEYPPDCRL
jgi:hypothetical protein